MPVLRRFRLGTFAVSALAGTSATAQEVKQTQSESCRCDYTLLTAQKEIAQSQPIASERTAPDIVAAEATGPDQDALAKAAQNPIASMISTPFQWNATTGTQWAPNSFDPYSKHDNTFNILHVQPVSLSS